MDLEINIVTSFQIYMYNYIYYFLFIQEDLPEIIELSDPDETPSNQRRILRNENENKQFDSDRYIADFIDGRNDPIFIQAMGIYI